MSRSGYSDDYDYEQWQGIMWRGAVASAFRGKRGQAFLREMLAALDALPEKRLISRELVAGSDPNFIGPVRADEVCALGAVGKARGLDMTGIDPEDHDTVAGKFDVAHAMACEIMFENDEAGGYWKEETPEDRFSRMRRWIAGQIRP